MTLNKCLYPQFNIHTKRQCCQRLCCKAPAEPKPEFSVLCLGYSEAGKSTLLSVLAGEPLEDLQPTIGFSIKAVLTSRVILNVKELGGSDRIRPYWDKYYGGHEAVVSQHVYTVTG